MEFASHIVSTDGFRLTCSLACAFIKQVFLKKNNQLIVEVMKKQEESTTNTEAANDKKSLQKVAEMIKELNENLTQVIRTVCSPA